MAGLDRAKKDESREERGGTTLMDERSKGGARRNPGESLFGCKILGFGYRKR